MKGWMMEDDLAYCGFFGTDYAVWVLGVGQEIYI